MDTSDEKLARELLAQLKNSGAALNIDNANSPADAIASANKSHPADEPSQDGVPTGDDNFFQALNAFRRAKASGDATAIAVAQANLQASVRAELRDGLAFRSQE